MSQIADALEVEKSATTLLVLFVPSHNRDEQAIDQEHWVGEALRVLGQCFGGATAFPQGRGVWRDDARGGKLLFDSPVVIQCYTSEAAIDVFAQSLRDFLVTMGMQTQQGAVGFVIDRTYMEIDFDAAPGG